MFDQKWLSTLFETNVIHQFARETRQPIKMRQAIGAVIGRYFWFPPPSKISPPEDFTRNKEHSFTENFFAQR